ncbi:hypothetical protein BC830DRAFT_1120977 [Chytriomyces sp. MP71]|nr:hypothetical protein BC830DRAFT_1120977 [Chytriomyces sp. MP71]
MYNLIFASTGASVALAALAPQIQSSISTSTSQISQASINAVVPIATSSTTTTFDTQRTTTTLLETSSPTFWSWIKLCPLGHVYVSTMGSPSP